jgi:hypothetical protein
MNRYEFSEENKSSTQVFDGMIGSGQTEKGERGKEQSHEHDHHFL